ncbi:MAG: response regulator [Candidatus Sericytochromatia bacterium]
MNRILYVEDEPSFQALVSIMLDRADFGVDVAASGEEGLIKALATPYDLILMDLCMPGMDGFEATRRLKQTDRYNSVPIVAVTGLTSPEDVKRAYSAGICDYIAKPFKRNQLLDLVYKHLSLAACED